MKKFAGFTPQQQFTLLSKQGYTGPADEASMAKFLAASPGAASKMGEYAQIAQQRLAGKPMPTQAMAVGGDVLSNTGPEAEAKILADANAPSEKDKFNQSAQSAVTDSNAQLSGLHVKLEDPETQKQREEFNSNPEVVSAGAAFNAAQEKLISDYMKQFGAPTDEASSGAMGKYISDKTKASPEFAELRRLQQALLPKGVADQPTDFDTPQTRQQVGVDRTAVIDAENEAVAAARAQAADPENEALIKAAADAAKAFDSAKQDYDVAQGQQRISTPTGFEVAGASLKDPMSLVQQASVSKIGETAGTIIDDSVGQAGAAAPTVGTSVTEIAQATAPDKQEAVKVEATKIGDNAPQATAAQGVVGDKSLVEAQQGKLSPEAIAEAAKFDDKFLDKVTSGELQVGEKELVTPAGQDAEAVKAEVAESQGIADVIAEQGVVRPEELPAPALIAEEDMAQAQAITAEGLVPDAVAVAARLEKFSVDNETLAQAMQGEVNALDTVQGQLSELMKSFDDGKTPAWAAGAIRTANAAMAARGVGGSSMAGAAIFQAAMESALPIASQDAQVFQQMNLTNLNNRQQVALANAAAQQGLQLQNLNNEQQAALQNSANSFSLQSQNLSNMQQTMLANAQIKAALQGQNLSNQQQTNLATAAHYAESANLNLNNRQQAALQNNANTLNIELANLSNKQQSYITNAQLEASLQGKQIDTQQQSAIANAARYADAANITFTADQQAKLHNSELMKTIGLSELNAKQAAVLQNAANVANLDLANLDNRQKAAVQNAQAFLQTDLTNLTNEQETAIFNTQNKTNTLLSDQAAENAAKQFNAASETQTNQFFAELSTTVSRFNAEQKNAIAQSNVSEANALAKFDTQIKAQREEFNASSSLVIAQANAVWRQNIDTLNTAAQNEATRDAAKAANGFTQSTVDQIWQRERDIMNAALTTAEGDANRNVSLMLGDKESQALAKSQKAAETSAMLQFASNLTYSRD